MRGFSKVVLAGNLTRDPEVRAVPSGSSVCSFSVAINRRYKTSSGEWQESVSYIDCSAWGRPGETIKQYLHKGSPILVSGRLEQHSWEDKTTGQKRSRVEVLVEDFNFLGGNNSSTGGNTGSNVSAPADMPDVPPEGEPNIDISEIPF